MRESVFYYRMNLYKDLATWSNEEKGEFHVVVEIPRGTSNKYEYDHEGGYIALDRVMHHSMFYPFDYGFIPRTTFLDGDPVDVCLLTTHPLVPGCVVKARVIGAIDTKDQDGEDLKIIAVPTTKLDPRFAEIDTIEHLAPHVREELLIFFKEMKKLEKTKYDKVEIRGWKDKGHALKEIVASQKRFEAAHQM